MSLDVRAETSIPKDPQTVWRYMTDPANEPHWIGGLKHARLLGDPPLAQGSRVERVAGLLGRRIEYVNEVVELDPPNRLEMRSIKAPFPMQITYTLAPDGPERTSVTNRVRGGKAGPLFALMAPIVKRNIQRDLNHLRDLLSAP